MGSRARQATTIDDKPRQYLQLAASGYNHPTTDLRLRKAKNFGRR